jgi:hypothetical protein
MINKTLTKSDRGGQHEDLSGRDGGARHVWEYAVDGGLGPFRGFSAFIQIRAPLGRAPQVEGFLATYRRPKNVRHETAEFRLTKRDVERVEVRTAQELQVDGEGSPCTAIVIYLKNTPTNALVHKIVIYPENDLAELLSSHDAPVGRMYGYFDEARPYRFQLTSRAA